MNKEEIFDKIIEWEIEAGESFADYFDSDINTPNLMMYCLGKGYITEEQYTQWEEAYMNNESEADSPCSYLYSEHPDELPYAIVVSEDGFDQDDYEKSYMILAEFMSMSKVYQERLEDFLEGKYKSNFKDAFGNYYKGDTVIIKTKDETFEFSKENGKIYLPFPDLWASKWYTKFKD